ncbi:MAG: hypothetical protein JO197_18010 [Acidobacteria bacterium]|nr:hypothetical protein [Acidobacteriota bacterium]MBV9479000.1 hypothetical protein [Acidobacteriota bacterium]
MRYTRVRATAGYTVDPLVVVNACVAARELARNHPRIGLYNFISGIADAHLGWFDLFLDSVVMHVERSQRVTNRFRTWRNSKRQRPRVIGKPDPIGAPSRRVRRFRDHFMDINAPIATTLAVRALDREEHTNTSHDFVQLLRRAYQGQIYALIEAFIELVERDRRFARRFRSWRRAKARRQQQGRPR